MTRKSRDTHEAGTKEDATSDPGGHSTRDSYERARENLMRLIADSVLDEMLTEGSGSTPQPPDPILIADEQIVDVVGKIFDARTVSTDGVKVRLQISGAAVAEWRAFERLRDTVGTMLRDGIRASDPCQCGKSGPKSYLECCHLKIRRLAEQWKLHIEAYKHEQ